MSRLKKKHSLSRLSLIIGSNIPMDGRKNCFRNENVMEPKIDDVSAMIPQNLSHARFAATARKRNKLFEFVSLGN